MRCEFHHLWEASFPKSCRSMGNAFRNLVEASLDEDASAKIRGFYTLCDSIVGLFEFYRQTRGKQR